MPGKRITRRKPPGTYVRPSLDFFLDRLGVATGSLTPAGYVVVGLYNDSDSGHYLHLYGVDISMSVAGLVSLSAVQGVIGNPVSDLLTIRQPPIKLAGQVYTASASGKIGDAVYPIHVAANVTTQYARTSPLFILPPGWGAYLFSAPVGPTLTGTFYALDMPDAG